MMRTITVTLVAAYSLCTVTAVISLMTHVWGVGPWLLGIKLAILAMAAGTALVRSRASWSSLPKAVFALLLSPRPASLFVQLSYAGAVSAIIIPSLPPAVQFNTLMALFIVAFIIAACLVAALFTFLLLKALEELSAGVGRSFLLALPVAAAPAYLAATFLEELPVTFPPAAWKWIAFSFAIDLVLGVLLFLLVAMRLASARIAPRHFIPLVAWKFLRSEHEVPTQATRLRLALRALVPGAGTSSFSRSALTTIGLVATVTLGTVWSAQRLVPPGYATTAHAGIACLAAAWLSTHALRAGPGRTAWLLLAGSALASTVSIVLILPAAAQSGQKVLAWLPVALVTIPPLVVAIQFGARAVLALLRGSNRLSMALDPCYAPPLETRMRRGIGASAFASVVGVAVGVWALIVVLSVMSGFSSELQERIVRTKDHIMVKSVEPAHPLPDLEEVASRIAKLSLVKSAFPYVEGEAMMSSHTNISSTVTVRGVPYSALAAAGIESAIISGSTWFFEHPEQLVAFPGLHPFLQQPSLGEPPEFEPEEVEGDFRKPNGEPMPGPGLIPMPDILDSADETGEASLSPPPLSLPRAAEGAWPTLSDQNVLPPLIIGQELARSLAVGVGSRVTVISPDGDVGPTGVQPKARAFLIAAVFSTGMYEYDLKLAFMNLPDAQRFFNLGSLVDHIDVRLTDLKRAPEVGARIQAMVPSNSVEVLTWQELNSNLFSALKLERVVMFIVLGLIILIASFNIIAALIILIRRRLAAIAILRTMGAAAHEVRRVFMLLGASAGLFGVASGVVLGLSSCGIIKNLGITLPREYYIRTLPVNVDPLQVVQVALAAFLMATLASLYPGRLAARMALAEGLKDER